jgi:alkylhydroperoxidase/carboxymuconolactone decarboxylase family protein YurZ
MSDDTSILTEITRQFGGQQPPVLFQQLAGNAGLLAATWQHYQCIMFGGRLDCQDKELIGLCVAIAKSNDYMTALQRRQVSRGNRGAEEELEAIAVAAFFEGFDAFAHALHVDSDLRPRRLEAGDLSLIDREIDVNVPYVVTSDDPVVRQVYGEIKAKMGIPFIPNIFKALAHQPAMLQAKWECYKAIMLTGRLRRRSKEMIAIAVSAVNGCFY